VLAVRKLGAPRNPELAVGAIAEDGTAVLNTEIAERAGMGWRALQATVERELRELHRRIERYRGGHAPLDVRERTVIVVDDGLATGLTDLAAMRALRARGAARIIVAVPIGARESLGLVGREADEVICLQIPRELFAVGLCYEDFSPVSDAEVLALVGAAASVQTPPPGQVPLTHRAPFAAPPGAGQDLELEVDGVQLAGELTLPAAPGGVVIFAHGSGSSRMSPRNRAVAATLNTAGLATLLFDLLSEQEGRRRELVFDIPLLAHRLQGVTRWTIEESDIPDLPIGYFGTSTGAAAALRAAAAAGEVVSAIVSRGGRVDLAADRIPSVSAATLLLVGARDPEVLALNRRAAAMLRCPHRLVVIDGADHLFTQPGTLETVARLAAEWFHERLGAAAPGLAAAS
jgi:predicted phosphoribosyltransferase/dienelactone hydrolase